MKPVIFLDFDGVINSARSALAFGGTGRHQLDPVAISLVARLAGKADAHVVISSAWRVGALVLDLKAILGQYSTALAGRVIDKTPEHGVSRGAEIAAWLASNPSLHNRQFVIIDDTPDFLDSQLPHFVNCSLRDGFGVPEYVKALSIIAPGHKDVTNLGYYTTDRPEPGKLIVLEWGDDE